MYNKPNPIRQLGVEGALTPLLKEAYNLVPTIEQNTAIVHCRPHGGVQDLI